MKVWILVFWLGDGLSNGAPATIDNLDSQAVCEEAARNINKTFYGMNAKFLCLEVVKRA